MPTSFVDNFYVMDPFAPPPAGTPLTAVNFVVTDQNNNGQISSQGHDSIDGEDIYAVYPGDTVTVEYPDGSTDTITGVTFYLVDGREVFSPIDGSTLQDGIFVSASWVPTNVDVTPAQLQLTCFTPGARIRTPTGGRAIETLKPGDLVVTADHGAQPIRWIGQRRVEGAGDFAPVRFMKGAIGNRRELQVSPQHRMMISGWRAELMFGEAELLVAAKHLVNGDTIHVAPCGQIEYIHLMFARHEVIFVEGVATESFHPGDYVLGQDRALMGELTALFPELRHGPGPEWITARHVLKGREAALVA
jgi:Hint domain-containing protein